MPELKDLFRLVILDMARSQQVDVYVGHLVDVKVLPP